MYNEKGEFTRLQILVRRSFLISVVRSFPLDVDLLQLGGDFFK